MSLSLKNLLPVLALAPVLCWAQAVLRDPTMPPPGVPMVGNSATAAAGGQAEPVVAQPVIRITPVVGRPVQPSPLPNAWRVVKITAAGVELKDSRGSRTVSAPPDTVRKKLVSGPASEK